MPSTDASPVRVLCVDDEPDLADLVATFLDRASDRIETRTATSAREGLEAVETGALDCVVSDYDMAGVDGLAFLEAVREDHPDLPFILYTGRGSEAVASDAISAGVTDYVQKQSGTDQYLVLANRVVDAVEQYRTREALARSEERNRRVVETSPAPIVLFGPDGVIDHANQAAAALVGADSPDDLVGQAIRDLVHPSCESLVETRMRTVLEDREPVPVSEQRYVGLDGEEVRAVVATAPVRYDGTDGAQAILVDVTELEETKRELARERVFVEEALDALEDVFYVIDTEGDLVRVNATVEELTGYTEAEALEMAPEDFFAEADRDRVRADIERAFAEGEASLQTEVVSADGETATFEFRKRRLTDEAGSVIGVAGIGRDVTDRVERERELERVRTRMELALQATDAIVWEWEPGPDTVSFYPADGPLYAPDVETFADFLEAIHPDDRQAVRSAVEEAFEEEASYQVDFRVDGEDGDVRWLATRGVVAGGNDRPTRLVGIARDITERKRREERLERTTEELEALNRLVRHDIRNDMTTLLGWAQMLEGSVDEDATDSLRKVLAAGERVVDLTETAGDYVEVLTAAEEVPTRPTPLRSVLETEVDLRRESAPRAEFVVEGDVPDVSVVANEMLPSVFRNLLGNAVHHSDQESPTVTITAEEREKSVLVTVADDGPGISDDRKETVFGKGERGLESDGTGIGLYLVRTLVEEYGGDVWVEDNEPRGARVVVRFPRVE